jgi:hypothetical protein
VVFFCVQVAYYGYIVSIPSRKPTQFDCPATYQITVLGRIDSSSSDVFGEMIICRSTVDAFPPVTTLKGDLRDQAALAGVLNTLYELHLTVISVLCLSYPPGQLEG